MALPIEDLQELARRKAVAVGINPDLFVRQITQESNWNPTVVNPSSGAMGLGQFMPATAREMGLTPTSVFNPEANLGASAEYMARMLKATGGDYAKALAAYNFGIGNIQKGKAWPEETRNYVSRIMGRTPIVSTRQSGPMAQRSPAFTLAPRPNFSLFDAPFPTTITEGEPLTVEPTPVLSSPQDELLALLTEEKPRIAIDTPEVVAENAAQVRPQTAPAAMPLVRSNISQIPIQPLPTFRARPYAPIAPIIPIEIPEATETIPPKVKASMQRELRSLTKQNRALRQKLTRGRKV
jgi:hypothetical protein